VCAITSDGDRTHQGCHSTIKSRNDRKAEDAETLFRIINTFILLRPFDVLKYFERNNLEDMDDDARGQDSIVVKQERIGNEKHPIRLDQVVAMAEESLYT